VELDPLLSSIQLKKCAIDRNRKQFLCWGLGHSQLVETEREAEPS
jgi:hypothetical protein